MLVDIRSLPSASPTIASKTIDATPWGALTASVWFTSWKQVLKCIYLDSHHLSLLSATRHALQVLTLFENSWVLANTNRNGNGACRPEQAWFVLWPFKLKSCSRIVGKQILLFLKGHCISRFNFLAQFYQCSLLKLIRYQSFLCYSHCDINKVTFNKSFMLFWSTALSCFSSWPASLRSYQKILFSWSPRRQEKNWYSICWAVPLVRKQGTCLLNALLTYDASSLLMETCLKLLNYCQNLHPRHTIYNTWGCAQKQIQNQNLNSTSLGLFKWQGRLNMGHQLGAVSLLFVFT